ncbi:MAG: NUDIX domain-containing protein [Methanobacteriota archaeon]|nr:MAG: NUDIX domain-containing protein [Euryarchaeota archaeon]TLZ73876.1 MAG: NUDIX domain-containing protein [Euryarchaeota archaeon]
MSLPRYRLGEASTIDEECRIHTLVADVAIIAQGQVLLVRYRDSAKYDHETGWFLPDDELQYLEHPERAGTRIVKEQLGLSDVKARLDHIESFKGNSGAWHMSFHSKAEMERKPRLRPSNDLAVAEWFDLGKLPPRDEVAHHGWALHTLETMAKRVA